MQSPPLSVVMSVYNGARYLDSAIASIAEQSFSDFEFLILDDGSTDETAQILSKWATRDSRIRPITRKNRGLVASLNELIGRARAPLVARMDADDISHKDRFARQMAFLDAHPEVGVLGTWARDIGVDGEDIALEGEEPPLTHQGVLEVIEQRNPLCHPSVIYRKALVEQVGGYHAAFRHCEDYDLWLRLAGITQITSLPERLISYRTWPQQVTARHVSEMHYGSIVARHAYRLRQAGRADPTEKMTQLPSLEELDSAFGEAGLSNRLAQQYFAAVAYSREAMQGAEFDRLIKYLRNGGSVKGHWRSVARLALRMHDPVRAARLAGLLALTALWMVE